MVEFVVFVCDYSMARKHPSPRPSPTRGEGTFPPLMGGSKGGWYFIILFAEIGH